MVDDDPTKELRDIKHLLEKILAILKIVNNENILAIKNSLLKNRTKQKIYELCDGKHTVNDIVKELGTTQPNVSYHLSSLLEAGLVIYKDVRGNRFYFKTLE